MAHRHHDKETRSVAFTIYLSRTGVSSLFGQRATCGLRMIARATCVFTAKTDKTLTPKF